MNLRILFCTICSCLVSSTLLAQDHLSDSPQNEYTLGASYGFGSLGLRDRVISTFFYDGSYQPLGFYFSVHKPHVIHTVNLLFLNKPVLKTETNKGFHYKGDLGEFFPDETKEFDFSTLKTRYFVINASSVYLLKKTTDKKIRAYLGYDLALHSFSKKFLQFEYVNEIRDRIYSLSPTLHLASNFSEKHLFLYDLTLPVLSHVKRTLYNPEADPTSVSEQKLTILRSFLGFDSQLAYQYRLASWMSLRAQYNFRYYQITFPQKEQWTHSEVSLGLSFHF